MKKSPVYLWLNAVASEFIEGCADAFLVVTGGAAVAQTGVATIPTMSPKQILCSVLIGGAWYAAAFLKKTPLPSAMPVKTGTVEIHPDQP